MPGCAGARAFSFPQRFTPGARASQDDGRPAWRSSWPCALFDWERHANPARAAYRYRAAPAARRAAQRVRPAGLVRRLVPDPVTQRGTGEAGARGENGADWNAFFRHYKAEMKSPDAAHALDLLAAMSQHSDLSVGCYCEDEAHCHRKRFASCWWRGATLAENDGAPQIHAMRGCGIGADQRSAPTCINYRPCLPSAAARQTSSPAESGRQPPASSPLPDRCATGPGRPARPCCSTAGATPAPLPVAGHAALGTRITSLSFSPCRHSAVPW